MIRNNSIQLTDMIGHGVVLLEEIDWAHQHSFCCHHATGSTDEVLKAVGIGEEILLLVDLSLDYVPGKLNFYEKATDAVSCDKYFMSPDYEPDCVHCGRVIMVMDDSE